MCRWTSGYGYDYILVSNLTLVARNSGKPWWHDKVGKPDAKAWEDYWSTSTPVDDEADTTLDPTTLDPTTTTTTLAAAGATAVPESDIHSPTPLTGGSMNGSVTGPPLQDTNKGRKLLGPFGKGMWGAASAGVAL
jgi:hypothetical protein